MRYLKLLKTLFFRMDFLLSFIVGVLLISTFYYFLVLRVSNLVFLYSIINRQTFYLISLISLVSVALFLFGVNFALSIFLLRSKVSYKVHSGGFIGGLVGGFAASCPACGAFLFSILGVGGGLSLFPLKGLEIWAISVFIMGFGFYLSLKIFADKHCLVDANNETCYVIPNQSKKFLFSFIIIALLLATNLYITFKRYDKPYIEVYRQGNLGPQCFIR